jgi:hypothetical protein
MSNPVPRDLTLSTRLVPASPPPRDHHFHWLVYFLAAGVLTTLALRYPALLPFWTALAGGMPGK